MDVDNDDEARTFSFRGAVRDACHDDDAASTMSQSTAGGDAPDEPIIAGGCDDSRHPRSASSGVIADAGNDGEGEGEGEDEGEDEDDGHDDETTGAPTLINLTISSAAAAASCIL